MKLNLNRSTLQIAKFVDLKKNIKLSNISNVPKNNHWGLLHKKVNRSTWIEIILRA